MGIIYWYQVYYIQYKNKGREFDFQNEVSGSMVKGNYKDTGFVFSVHPYTFI